MGKTPGSSGLFDGEGINKNTPKARVDEADGQAKWLAALIQWQQKHDPDTSSQRSTDHWGVHEDRDRVWKSGGLFMINLATQNTRSSLQDATDAHGEFTSFEVRGSHGNRRSVY